MEFTRKINKLFKLKEDNNVDGAEVWMLTWRSYQRTCYDEISTYSKVQAKAFLNERDAELFAQSLKDANELLQNITNLMINITKQK